MVSSSEERVSKTAATANLVAACPAIVLSQDCKITAEPPFAPAEAVQSFLKVFSRRLRYHRIPAANEGRPSPDLHRLTKERVCVVSSFEIGFTVAGQEAVKVYVVDDEPVIALTVCTILAGAGFEAKAFFHPADLLREASLCHPQVVLSDVMMPEMNGLDLSLRLQMDHPECKVILFSGHVETLELLEAARAHGHEFEVLTKPVRPEDLLVRLRALVGDRQPVLAA